MRQFILVHSPLVGPSTWGWVGSVLRANGDDAIIPTISSETRANGWSAVVAEVANQVRDTSGAVFVAHSGAGPLLPNIVESSGAVAPTIVFVDAGFPSLDQKTALVPPDLFEMLTSVARNGVLPPWSEWFGPEAMSQLVPDEAMRARITAEIPKMPLAYFSDSVPPVNPWPAAKTFYVLLSDGYVDEAAEARRRGWPVFEARGQHLDIVTSAHHIAEILSRC